ncbi:MAG: hypothetical protein FWE03_00445 [Firmicutes bacterium]|nr:hypothetical protein [Bacillota bacterium]
MMAFYSTSKKNSKVFDKSLKWLQESVKSYSGHINNMLMLIEVYNRAKMYDTLIEFDKLLPPNKFRLTIAGMLYGSKQFDNIKHAKRIYQEVSASDSDIVGIRRGLFGCCYSLGEIQEAKNYICQELDLNNNKEDYFNLLQLRLETNDFTFDKYFEGAKGFIDDKLDHLIGVFYLEKKMKVEARQFLLRSLLSNETNLHCLNAYMGSILGDKERIEPQKVDVGVTVFLKDTKGKIIMIAIHNDNMLPKFRPNRFAKCFHYKQSDSAVEGLLFEKVGSQVVYKGKELIDKIEINEATFCAFAMAHLVKNKKATQVKIKNDNPENALDGFKKS